MNIKSMIIMNRLKILIIFLIAVGLSSCDLLEKPEPKQSLPSEGGLEEIGDFESALVGAYDNVQTLDGGDNAGHMFFLNDIITDDAFWTGSFPTYVEVSVQEISPDNGSTENHWNGAYEAINAANIILDGLDGLDADQAAIDNIRGQALYIRAFEYFYLLNYFAKPWGATSDNSHLGVPLQLEPVTSEAEFSQPSRSSVADVYGQIIADLQQAQGLISNTTPNRATEGAVTGLLARIALIQGRWADAADLADQVIPDYSLGDTVTDYFRNELSDESIFEIQNTTQDAPDGANTSLTAVYNEGSRDDIQVSEEFVGALDAIITDDQEAALSAGNLSAEDTRETQLLTGTDTPADVQEATAASNSTKYEDFVNNADNVPVMRLPEMMLTRAEALARDAATLADVPQEAFDLVNQIRTRAIIVTDDNGAEVDPVVIEHQRSDFASKDEFIDAVLAERRVELAFEGHRKTDLQRLQMDVGGSAWDANNITFPIPQSQIDANPNITQNDGYTS